MTSHLGFYFAMNEDKTNFAFNCPCCKTTNKYINTHLDDNDAFERLICDTHSAISERRTKVIYSKESYHDSTTEIMVPLHGNELDYTCPNCKETGHYYFYNPLYRVRGHHRPFFVGASVSEDYARLKLNIKGVLYTFYNNKVQTHYYMTRVVFNKRTGRVSMMRPIGKNDKALDLFYDYPRIWNITYGASFTREDLHFVNDSSVLENILKEEFVPRITKALQERFPYIKDNHFDDCYDYESKRRSTPVLRNPLIPFPAVPEPEKEKVTIWKLEFEKTLSNLILKFRFHDFEMPFLRTIINSRHDKKIMSLLSRIGYRSKQQVSDYYKLLPKTATKKIRKAALNHIQSITVIREMDFIQAPANLAKVLEAEHYSYNGNHNGVGQFYYFYMPLLLQKYEKMFRNEEKLRQHCETLFVNRIITSSPYQLSDTIRMYEQINRLRQNEEDKPIVDVTLSIKELHDYLVSVYNSIRFKNYALNYTEQDKQIEWQNDKYVFKLAPDTNYLRNTGRVMSICVGSYADSALSKHLSIVTVSSKENELECCIELTGDMIAIKQAKINRNQRPTGDLLAALWDWAKEKDLIVNTADMYSHEDESQFYDARADIRLQIETRRRMLGYKEEEESTNLQVNQLMPAPGRLQVII